MASEESTDLDASAVESAVEETAAEAPAPKRRRATKKAAAPQAETLTEGYAAGSPAADDSPAAAGEAAEASEASGEGASKPRARKTTKQAVAKKPAKKSAKSTEATEGAAAADATDDTDATALAPAKKAMRATRSRKAAAPNTDSEVKVEVEVAEATSAEAEATGLDVPVVDEAEVIDDLVEEPEPEAADAAAAPSFGLLFQAPDTTAVRRSRRATAPAAAPAPAAEKVESAAGTDTAGADDADRGADVAEDEAGSGTRRSRSRSRGRSAAKAAATDTEASADTSASADDAGDATDARGDTADGSDPGEGSDAQSGTESGRRRRRGGRGRRARSTDGEDSTGSDEANGSDDQGEGTSGPGSDGSAADDSDEAGGSASSRRRRRRRRSGNGAGESDDPPGTVTRVREPRKSTRDEPTAVKGSTRLEAKKQRRREGREAGRRRTIITEAEFLARRESVERVMVVRGQEDRTQIGVLEDGVLVEHYVSRETATTMVGNVYLGRVQNVLPSMEAAFVDIGKGRNAVLYAGEVNWDAAGLEVNQAKRIENALTSGDSVLVQVTKDPIGHKGARLTSQISLPGRFLVYVPEGSMTGISRKLPDTERARLKAILKEIVPDSAGVIVRTAAEGASEEELRADVERLTKAWDKIQAKAEKAKAKKAGSGAAPVLVHGEPDLTVRVIRDIFTEDFTQLVVSGEKAWADVSDYVEDVAPDLAQRLTRWTSEQDLFTHHRVQEQIAKAMDRKVWLPSGGSLVIDRTEAMTVVDVNTGKFVGSGGNLEETVTKNNIEAAEEIVRQLRLRDIGGIIVIDFIDMVLESNRDLVVRRLLECLGRDRTKHQVAEVTSLGLVQMTRKRVGSGLIEVFSETCEHCSGRGIVVHSEPIDKTASSHLSAPGAGSGSRGRQRRSGTAVEAPAEPERKQPTGPTAAQIAAAAHAAAMTAKNGAPQSAGAAEEPGAAAAESSDFGQDAPVEVVREFDGDDASAEFASEVLAATDSAPADAEGPLADAEPDLEPPTDNEPDPQSDAEPQPQVAAEPEPEQKPARGRRRRGRVVAPAGPPRHTPEAANPTDA